MSSLQPRQLRAEDAAAVSSLFVDGWGVSRQMDDGEIREWVGNEALESENLIVVEQDGQVVGYFDVWPEGETADLDVAAPGFWDETFAFAEGRARELGAMLVRIQFIAGHDVEQVVEARGYEPIRSSWTMEIELGLEAPAEAVVPDGVEIRPYRHPEDEQAVYEANQEAFADHWGFHPISFEQWRGFSVKSRSFDPTLWFVGWDGDQVAGLATSEYERHGDPGYGWVASLCVRRPWRRRGLGEALLRRSFAALHARGQQRVRLGVDAESLTGATRLYERAGMSVLMHWTTWEREL